MSDAYVYVTYSAYCEDCEAEKDYEDREDAQRWCDEHECEVSA